MRRVLAALTWLALALTAPAHAADGLVDPGQVFKFSVTQSAGVLVRLHWVIAPGYYLYRDRIGTVASLAVPLQVNLPAGEPKSDPNFGTMVVYRGAPTVDVAAAGARTLNVTWQDCAQVEHPELNFVFVNQGETRADIVRYLQGQHMLLSNVLIDAALATGAAFDQRALPTTLLFDAEGRLVSTHIGAFFEATPAQSLTALQGTSRTVSPPGPSL